MSGGGGWVSINVLCRAGSVQSVAKRGIFCSYPLLTYVDMEHCCKHSGNITSEFCITVCYIGVNLWNVTDCSAVLMAFRSDLTHIHRRRMSNNYKLLRALYYCTVSNIYNGNGYGNIMSSPLHSFKAEYSQNMDQYSWTLPPEYNRQQFFNWGM